MDRKRKWMSTHQDTVLNRSSWNPVEHSSAVIFHLCLDKIKVSGLIISNPNIHLVSSVPVHRLGMRPATLRKITNMEHINVASLQNTTSRGTYIYYWGVKLLFNSSRNSDMQVFSVCLWEILISFRYNTQFQGLGFQLHIFNYFQV